MIAFYAPMKPPDHPVPSGDRQLAQGILTALSMNSPGLPVKVASQLRCYDGKGDTATQQQIKAKAKAEVDRLLSPAHKWQAWFTYHNYYKAPDLIGRAVCQQLDIPYFIIEASIAKSRSTGAWADFCNCADLATESADCVFYLTEKDRAALAQHQPEHQKLVHLAPFLVQTTINEKPPAPVTGNQLLAVGMHRYGDKFASYKILAEALTYLKTQDWQLSIVGDGPARDDIALLFREFGERVIFLGQLDRTAINDAYQRSSLFVWPGVNEAFGMVYLEAQASGLPVVAQDRSGVREVIASSHSLVPEGDASLLAQRIDLILADSSLYKSMVSDGRHFIRQRHLLDAAANTLSAQLQLALQ